MDISSQPCFITGGSDLEDSWSILRFCCSQTQEDSPLILLSSPIVPKCLKHAVSENHRLNPFRVHRHSAPEATGSQDLHRSPWAHGSPHSGVLRLELCWDSGCGVCGVCRGGAAIVTAMGAVAAGTAGTCTWWMQNCWDFPMITAIPWGYLGHMGGISYQFLSYLQDITTYYKMEPKLSMWQNDANITLAKLLEVHGIQLAHLVDSTYRLVDPHVRC